MDRINKCMEELQIQPPEKSNKEHEKFIAGKIDNVIGTLNLVLIKPRSSNTLLCLGAPLFLNFTSNSNIKSEYILLGYIDDIFGPIKEPMYSVTIKCDPIHILNVNTLVYYFPNDENTKHICVQYSKDETINKEKYYVRMLKY
ncbi:uncharacterized protein LOC105663626 [Megachile rotundata]|uniref:uncharacterized protein LOC105663626 n=1 Tax=Megachile rotundata TaxID=143995 RepID=UPI00061523DB|nr:PREDICTED: uncharacterized protein LOC105663626 [Megachile rotundata]